MDLNKCGTLLRNLRKDKNLTQKQLAEFLGISAKTVSKWETGHGFPDVSTLSALAEILGVSEKILLTGSLKQNIQEVGNIKKLKFYVCPHCGSFAQGVGENQVICCGKPLEVLSHVDVDAEHIISITEMDNDYYIEFDYEMTKDHFISFVAYVGFDRSLFVKLYPEQEASVRIPRMFRGKLYFYCTNHGLFKYKP